MRTRTRNVERISPHLIAHSKSASKLSSFIQLSSAIPPTAAQLPSSESKASITAACVSTQDNTPLEGAQRRDAPCATEDEDTQLPNISSRVETTLPDDDDPLLPLSLRVAPSPTLGITDGGFSVRDKENEEERNARQTEKNVVTCDLPNVTSAQAGTNAQPISKSVTDKGQLRDATSDDFISGYYKASRLHHLSLWRAQFEDELNSFLLSLNPTLLEKCEENQLEQRKARIKEVLPDRPVTGEEEEDVNSSQDLSDKRLTASRDQRIIMHVDMVRDPVISSSPWHHDLIVKQQKDCFFASVAIRSNPMLMGKPVVVAHSNSANGTSSVASASYEARKYGTQVGPHTRFVTDSALMLY